MSCLEMYTYFTIQKTFCPTPETSDYLVRQPARLFRSLGKASASCLVGTEENKKKEHRIKAQTHCQS